MATWLVLLVLLPTASQDAWEYGPWTYYSFQPSLELSAPDGPAMVSAMFPLPQENHCQKLMGVFQTADDLRFFQRDDNNKLNQVIGAEIDLEQDEKTTFAVTYCIGRRSVRLRTENLPSTPDSLLPRQRTRLKPFLDLTPGTGLDDPVLAEVAKSFTQRDNTVTLARQIYDRVLERMQYEKKLSFKGAARAWQECVGECGDYAALFVSLCRQTSIPARGVAGFAFRDEQWEHHVWAEFYVPDIGWVPCDPSFGDAGPAAADRYFAQLDGSRLALSRDFDLDFTPPEFLKVVILQEYLFAYSGAHEPERAWSVNGLCFGESLPKDYRTAFGDRVVPTPWRRRR